MWALKYNNEFFDLVSGQDAELQRNSPLFFFDDTLAEYSTPISLAASDKNNRLLSHLFIYQTSRVPVKIDIEVWDAGSFKAQAKLAIEAVEMNRLFHEKGNASGFILMGASSFIALIKNVKLTDLSLGQQISHLFTTWNAGDNSNGFMQKFQDTWDFNDNYVVVPCRNENWNGVTDDTSYNGYMNELDPATNNLKGEQDIVAFLKIQFVLESIFKENGWSIDTAGLNDEQWKKLILFNARPIPTRIARYDIFNPIDITYEPLYAVNFRLRDFLPQDYTCADFILQLCRRYGWVPIFDTNRNNCRLVALKEMKTKPVKDWTAYAAPVASSPITPEAKTFAFKTVYDGNDRYPATPSFDNWIFGEPVANKSDLPNPYGGLFGAGDIPDNMLVYAYLENQWYNVEYNSENYGGNGGRDWVVFADNIYDDGPTDATNTFETKMGTLPIYKTLYRTSGTNYYALFPYCEQSKYEKWGMRTLLYHGMVRELNENGTQGPKSYPYASSTHLLPNGTAALTWSNVYRHEFNGVDKGIRQYWWQSWLDMLSGNEDAVVQRFYVPYHVYLQYQWDDIILVNNVPFVFRSLVEKPVKDELVTVEATMQRINYKASAVATDPDVPAGTFLRLEEEITGTNQDFEFTVMSMTQYYNNATTAFRWVRAYSDAACTIPKSLTDFSFRFRVKNFKEEVYYSGGDWDWTLNGQEQDIVFSIYNTVEYDYTDNWESTMPDGHYRVENELLPGVGYSVVP